MVATHTHTVTFGQGRFAPHPPAKNPHFYAIFPVILNAEPIILSEAEVPIKAIGFPLLSSGKSQP